MPSGILGEADLLAATPTNLYTVPAGKVVTFTASFCNRGTGTAKVTLRVPKVIGDLTSFYEYKFPIPAGSAPLERTGLVAEAGRNIVVESDQALVTAIVHGFEEGV
ncbi:MAG: hypothetical protein ACTIBJ_05485 [Pseudomonas helleri]|uniref:hypothetical protein n=1 Tax=Pseudomonas helleri TaxID=1608996 RepID=UPI003F9605B4